LNSRTASKAIIACGFTMAVMLAWPLKAQSPSRSTTEPESSAVDINGIRHGKSEYGDRTPWTADLIKFVKPDYPIESRARRAEGTGLFRMNVDVNTGAVTKIAVIRSTGHAALDHSAMRSMRLWRWRPRQWKEIDMPVIFDLQQRGQQGASVHEVTARGAAQYRADDITNAIKTLNEAVQRQPTSAEGYIMRGAAYQVRDNAAKALADFNKAIELDPKSARAYCDRAALEEELLHEPDKALADYDQAIRLAPKFHRAYSNRGVYFLARHDYEHAIADFSRAIQLIPNDGGGYALRAFAYAKLGQHSRAASDAATAIKFKPSEPPLFRGIDLAIRAKAYMVLGQSEAALRDLQEAVRLIPDASVIKDNLAWFLATYPNDRLRNGTEAIAVAREACELSHWQRINCYDTLAAAYAEAGDFERAVKYEKQAVTGGSLVSKEREEFQKHLSLFEQRKPFRDEF
jgi:TonB family protein